MLVAAADTSVSLGQQTWDADVARLLASVDELRGAARFAVWNVLISLVDDPTESLDTRADAHALLDALTNPPHQARNAA